MDNDRKLEDVKIGDVVRGYCRNSQRIVVIIVEKLNNPGDYLYGVVGRELNPDGSIKDRKKHVIARHIPGFSDGNAFEVDRITGEKSFGGWTYSDIQPQPEKRGMWANPIRELAVGATVDFDCDIKTIQTIRVCASYQGSVWRKKFKVEKTLSGCAVTRIS